MTVNEAEKVELFLKIQLILSTILMTPCLYYCAIWTLPAHFEFKKQRKWSTSKEFCSSSACDEFRGRVQLFWQARISTAEITALNNAKGTGVQFISYVPKEKPENGLTGNEETTKILKK